MLHVDLGIMIAVGVPVGILSLLFAGILWSKFIGCRINPGLPSNKYYERAKKYLPNGGCGVVSFGLKGGRAAASTFMQNLKLGAIETHVADARTCCLNPATSTHRQMTDEQLKEAGVPAELVRISLGLEDKEDLIADISQALDAIAE